MLKRDTNQPNSKSLTSILLNLYNFQSLEVVNRVDVTKRQVGDNSR